MLTLNDFTLYFNIAFFGIIGLGVLGGLVHGFKKSLYTFVTMLIFYVIFFITIDAVVNQLWTMESEQIGVALAYVNSAFASVTSFDAAVPVAISIYLGDTIDPALLSPAVMSLAGGLGIFVLKIVYTILYFTVILIIYKIICWIIKLIFGGKHDPHAAKNPGFGALIGLLNGVMALFVFLIMFGGVVDIVKSVTIILPEQAEAEPDAVDLEFPRWELYEAHYSLIDYQETAETGNQAIPENAIAMMKDMVTAYESNLLVTAAGIITIPDSSGTREIPLNLYLFDMVLSFEFADKQIAIRNEMSVFSEVIMIILNSDFATSNEISDLTSDEVKSMFSTVSSSEFIVTIMPLAIEFAADYFDVDLGATPEQLAAIDWETELSTLGDIAESIFIIINAQAEGTDWSTLPDQVDGDFIRSLFTSMANSSLMIYMGEAFIEPYLSNPENSVSSFFVIPPDLNWSNEFLAIGEALGAIFDESDTFALTELGLATIVNLTPSSINKIFDSQILVATISQVLLTQDLDGMGLVIPNSVFDANDYLKKEELNALALSIQLIYNATTCAPEDDGCSGFAIAEVLNLDENELDTLFSSEIISATVGKLLYDMGSDVLTIPNISIDNLAVGDSTVNVVKTTEIRKVFNALNVLGFEDFEFSSFTASILNRLDDGTGSLDSNKLTTLFESTIIQATISSILLDNLPIVPDSVKEMVGNVECITIVELSNAFKALYELGITDFAGENFTPAKIFLADFDIVLTSEIVRASISDAILDFASTSETATPGSLTLIVPNSLRQDVTINDVLIAKGLIELNELKALLNALSLLGFTDFSNGMSASTIASMNAATLDEMLQSGSIHITIDNLAKGNSAITDNIPILALDDLYGVDDVIIAEEIRNFILAANELGESSGSDFSDISISLAGVESLDTSSQSIVLNSMIVLNIITPDLETICSNPFNPYVLDSTDYEDNNTANFLLKATVLDIIDFYTL